MFTSPFSESIIKRAQEKKLVKIDIHDLRKWTKDKHKTVDDRPFGGGAGMVMMVEPIYRAVREICNGDRTRKSDLGSKGSGLRSPDLGKKKAAESSPTANSLQPDKVKQGIVLLTAKGETFTQKKAEELSKLEQVILICGHYEGVDHRVHEHIADEEISIGDYVLSGGEIPAMVVVDTVVRLIPGVLGNVESLREESFVGGRDVTSSVQKEYPQYTRPAEFETDEREIWKVPEVLLSGDHGGIKKWREKNRDRI